MEGGNDYYENGGGFGGFSSSLNPLFKDPRLAGIQQDPTKVYQAAGGPNGGYYTYDNYTGPNGQGQPVLGQTPWQKYSNDGSFLTQGVMKSDDPTSLFALAALAAGGMAFGLPGLMGTQAGGAGAAGGVAGASSTSGGGLFSGLGNSFSGLGSSFSGLTGGSGGGGMGLLDGLMGSGGGSFGWGNLLSSGLNYLGSQQTAKAAQGALGAAADASKFRPVGVTTRFGQSGFQFDGNGNLTGAGYSLSPELAGFREKLLDDARATLGNARNVQGTANGLFGLGQEYLAQSPEEAAQNWMTKQQSVLAPGRERALSGIRTNLFNTGRSGLSVGATGTRPDGSAGLGAANPELEAYYNSIAQQDSQLAAGADQFARDQITFGNGLLSSGLNLHQAAYNPFKTALGLSGTVDAMGAETLDTGMKLGGMNAQGGDNAARYLAAGGYSPTGGFLTSLANNPALLQVLNGMGGSQNPEAWRTTGSGMPSWY